MASNRHLGRIVALQTLYERDFRLDCGDKNFKLDDVLKRNINRYHQLIDDQAFVKQLVHGVDSKQAKLDAIPQPAAPQWPIDQIARIDRIVLRIGLHELLHDKSIPAKVVINEAVELAKAFGGDNSSKFINGVLGTILRQQEDRRKKAKKAMKRPKPIQGFKKFVSRRRPAINEVVREPTAGGIVFRRHPKTNTIDILLIQDAKNRWTIPKGHIEESEAAKETAEREIREETGLKDLKVLHWLGKINFRYRRQQSLVLMTTEIFLVRAGGKTNKLNPEEWMNGIKWFPASEALDKIEYEDIGKIILLALKKIRDDRL